jgi:hypothetical protein
MADRRLLGGKGHVPPFSAGFPPIFAETERRQLDERWITLIYSILASLLYYRLHWFHGGSGC